MHKSVACEFISSAGDEEKYFKKMFFCTADNGMVELINQTFCCCCFCNYLSSLVVYSSFNFCASYFLIISHFYRVYCCLDFWIERHIVGNLRWQKEKYFVNVASHTNTLNFNIHQKFHKLQTSQQYIFLQ